MKNRFYDQNSTSVRCGLIFIGPGSLFNTTLVLIFNIENDLRTNFYQGQNSLLHLQSKALRNMTCILYCLSSTLLQLHAQTFALSKYSYIYFYLLGSIGTYMNLKCLKKSVPSETVGGCWLSEK